MYMFSCENPHSKEHMTLRPLMQTDWTDSHQCPALCWVPHLPSAFKLSHADFCWTPVCQSLLPPPTLHCPDSGSRKSDKQVYLSSAYAYWEPARVWQWNALLRRRVLSQGLLASTLVLYLSDRSPSVEMAGKLLLWGIQTKLAIGGLFYSILSNWGSHVLITTC